MDSEEKEIPQNPSGIAGKPLQPVVTSPGKTYEAFQAGNVQAAPKPKPTIQESADVLHNEGPIKNLRTYESDVADMMKEKDTSVIKVAVAEQTRSQERGTVVSHEDPKMSMYTLGLSGLLILSGLAVVAAFIIIVKNPVKKPEPVKIDPSQIISTETSRQVTLTAGENPLIAINRERTTLGNPESLTRLTFVQDGVENNKPVKKPLDIIAFTTALDTRMLPAFIRSLDPYFLAGYYTHESQTYPFFIFKTSAYENTFAGMLEWEKYMIGDLANILPHPAPLVPVVATSTATTTATSTPKTKAKAVATTTPPAPKAPTYSDFTDEIIKNKDVRVVRNSDGIPVLMYTFSDKQTLVIATNEAALKELLARLVTSQFVR